MNTPVQLTHRLEPADLHRLNLRAGKALLAARRQNTHLWTAMVAYLVQEPNPAIQGSLLLDQENLFTYPEVGCFVCEEPWSEALAAKPCPGDPG